MRLDDIYIRDPYILVHQDTYYLYGKKRQGDTAFVVYTSSDLEEWSEPKVVFSPAPDFWGTRDFWAPEVHCYQGRFYMLASFKAEGSCRATHILAADSPDGEFKPVSPFPATPPEWECLDGTLYVDGEGTPYMVFCHEWTQICNGTMCYAPLKSDLSGFAGEPRVMFAARDYDFVKTAIEGREAYVTDGPFLHRGKDGSLRLIWSSFGEKGYLISALKSDNGRLDGHWSAENLLFDGHGGHGMIFRALDGQLRLVLHAPNHPWGSERARLFRLQENERGELSICQE